jgi:hypothetical protein
MFPEEKQMCSKLVEVNSEQTPVKLLVDVCIDICKK